MPAVDKVEEICGLVNKDKVADHIAMRWQNLKQNRSQWEDEKLEIRNYVFATDTRTTTNATLPWKNTTTVPKLCQIRDNLHANYMAALFPREDWLTWVAGDREAAEQGVSKLVRSYMRTKLEDSNFEETVSQLIYDYIDYGNAIADVEYVEETFTNEDGEVQVRYVGPRLVRINPLDCVFDISARSFEGTPKITRSIMSLGDLERYADEHPEKANYREVIDKMYAVRQALSSYSMDDIERAVGWRSDGFGTAQVYYASGYVELLEFEGDIYLQETGELKKNRRIVVVDRAYVLEDVAIESWLGGSYKQHVGWRTRQDNILAMGPLDNLVGMQYRIDHLQNIKSDIYDLTAFPPLKVRGVVDDFEWKPMERVYLEDDADVSILQVDVNALNADIEIDWLENKMEEMAGAPRQAMGFRTPGEKTAYEVRTLENNASRVFNAKIKQFERNFLEPLINKMLEIARRNMDGSDVARVTDDTLGIQKFMTITPEILKTRGRLRPVGAQNFADKAMIVQNVTNLFSGPLAQDPVFRSSWSQFKLAKLMESALGLEDYELVSENVGLSEQQRLQQLQLQLNDQSLQAAGQLSIEEEMELDEDPTLQRLRQAQQP